MPTSSGEAWFVLTSRWISSVGDETYDSREAAVAAVEAELAEMFGGWRTCPPSHTGGCKWRRMSADAWAEYGFNRTATDRWIHSTERTDVWHRERIYVAPGGSYGPDRDSHGARETT